VSNDPILQLDDAQKKVLPRIEALLRLYDRGKDAEDEGTLKEAMSALSKAQELLEGYNLSADMLNQGGDDGVREEQKLEGGGREYERDLWRAVAELNFCLYFSSRTNKVTAYKRTRADGSKYIERETKSQPLHRLVGRKVNVMATISMARYLEDAVERLVGERIGPDNARERWSKFNITFRKGAASTVTNKLYKRREELIAEDERKRHEAEEQARQRGMQGVSTSTALTVATHTQAEEDANKDFARGWKPGTSAANRAQWQAEQAARAERARRIREEAVQWAKDNPEEARKQAEQQRKEQEEAEKREARNAKRRTGGWRWTKADDRREEEAQAFAMGAKAGHKISIDQQMSAGKREALG
jgi:hypothetical protein